MHHHSTLLLSLFFWFGFAGFLQAQVHTLSLEQLVTPSSLLSNVDGKVPVTLYGFLEFDNLWEMFGYIDQQAGRWKFDGQEGRQNYAESLFKRGAESRVISMTYSIPHEILITHTRQQLEAALETIHTPHEPLIYKGTNWSLDAKTYRQIFLDLQTRWKGALNCWSAGPSVAERALSNWYIIREGIELFGATYDSTEHFWQAVKFHPEVTLQNLKEILAKIQEVSWEPWLDQLSNDQNTYLTHTYAIEFLKQNLTNDRLRFFDSEVERYAQTFDVPVRQLQQRAPEQPWHLRFTALQEKILWGDLADVFHLIYFFTHLEGDRFQNSTLKPLITTLQNHHFDGIYLKEYSTGKLPFISPEFRQLMLDIWRVKFLKMQRFREVLLSTQGYRLLHFLNDGDSPDIPIPIYVGFLGQIRELARQQ